MADSEHMTPLSKPKWLDLEEPLNDLRRMACLADRWIIDTTGEGRGVVRISAADAELGQFAIGDLVRRAEEVCTLFSAISGAEWERTATAHKIKASDPEA